MFNLAWQAPETENGSIDLVSFQYSLIGRDINERIWARASSEEGTLSHGQTRSFVCECEDPDCESQIRLTYSQYHGIRQNPNAFVMVVGHRSQSFSKVLHREDYWILIERSPSRPEVMAGGVERAASRKNPFGGAPN